MAKILRKSQGSISKIQCFVGQNSILRHYYIQNLKDGIQIRVCKINKEKATQFIPFTPVK